MDEVHIEIYSFSSGDHNEPVTSPNQSILYFDFSVTHDMAGG